MLDCDWSSDVCSSDLLVILADPGEVLDAEALPADIRRATSRPPASAAPLAAPSATAVVPPSAAAGSLDDLTVAAMRAAVEACGGNVTRAAARLGVHRSTLYRTLGRPARETPGRR
jgi:transcriptional regulator of acetoin/glycerol metabolism